MQWFKTSCLIWPLVQTSNLRFLSCIDYGRLKEYGFCFFLKRVQKAFYPYIFQLGVIFFAISRTDSFYLPFLKSTKQQLISLFESSYYQCTVCLLFVSVNYGLTLVFFNYIGSQDLYLAKQASPQKFRSV